MLNDVHIAGDEVKLYNGVRVPIFRNKVKLISVEEMRAEGDSAWHYAISTYGEEGLWLGRKNDNIVIYKFGVLKETL
jgi:hypothetical protein